MKYQEDVKCRSGSEIGGDDVITVRNAARNLGIGKIRVLNLINTPCPACRGEPDEMATCERCRGTGKRLPAKRFGNQSNSPWMVFAWGLTLADVVERKPGNPNRRKP